MDHPYTMLPGPEERRGGEARAGGAAKTRCESPVYDAPRVAFQGEGATRRRPAGLTQLGAQMRLDTLCYVVDSLRSVESGWPGLDQARRFSLSLTWQYLVTGRLPALHRHYLLEGMTRDQCLRYEAFLGDLRKSASTIDRLGFFPPWRTLESVTAEAVLDGEIPHRPSRGGRASRPAGRYPYGRRRPHKRFTDRLLGYRRRGPRRVRD